MDLITIAISGVFVAIFTGLITRSAYRSHKIESLRHESKMSAQSFTMSFAKGEIRMVITCAILLGLSIIACLLLDVFLELEMPNVVYGLFAMLFVPSALASLIIPRKKLKVEGNSIYYTPAFAKEREFTFADIGNVRVTGIGEMLVYTAFSRCNEKMFAFESDYVGATLMVERFKQEGYIKA
ncbi:MAG: hypothetical protein LBD23_17010 [Oscillospiraceae bacterium]|jgi:hypothetical protein|nr:hypothetical protein [Oscillospiraceae bacterium]